VQKGVDVAGENLGEKIDLLSFFLSFFLFIRVLFSGKLIVASLLAS